MKGHRHKARRRANYGDAQTCKINRPRQLKAQSRLITKAPAGPDSAKEPWYRDGTHGAITDPSGYDATCGLGMRLRRTV